MPENCCPSDMPPVVVEGYELKGAYNDFGGLKTYVTGSSDSKVGLLAIYDIFGFFPQTQQGADILASNLNAVVAMPDFFEGEPASTDIYPPTTPEKTSALQRFFSTKADLTANQQRVDTVIKALKEEFKGVEKWAVIGCCWGGKISTLVSGKDTPFSASVMIHPAFVDSANAEALTIPQFLYASVDESADAVVKYQEALKNHPIADVRDKSVVETRSDMYHGWMAARAKLHEEKYLKGYQEGYARVITFLKGVL